MISSVTTTATTTIVGSWSARIFWSSWRIERSIYRLHGRCILLSSSSSVSSPSISTSLWTTLTHIGLRNVIVHAVPRSWTCLTITRLLSLELLLLHALCLSAFIFFTINVV